MIYKWGKETLRQACLRLDVNYKLAWDRLNKGYSTFEALYGIRQKFKKDTSNIEGKRFGSLLVLHIDKSNSKGSDKISYICQCDCGNITVATKYGLTSGRTKSCKICSGNFVTYRSKHGLTDTHFYRKYRSMQDRCNNPKIESYPLYGGRGIKCRWCCFEDFMLDMYESYLEHVEQYGEKDTTLDRINPNDDYYKENCRWATCKEQARNTRNTTIVEYRGLLLPLRDLCDCFVVSIGALRQYARRHNNNFITEQLIDTYLDMKLIERTDTNV